ncbi:hypothetical protein SAMN06265349_102135 [Flavobacterium resistens]|uniref:Uncharacterized protein n=1 Tax=Flavobacterium resistens TaxID=443612 RepID=A0A521C229_9FLAO|nr:hypothetical protein SAMN06265349_102135 [Flavobacterium resistens]
MFLVYKISKENHSVEMKQIISVKFTFTNVCKIIPQKQKNCFLIFLIKKMLIFQTKRDLYEI